MPIFLWYDASRARQKPLSGMGLQEGQRVTGIMNRVFGLSLGTGEWCKSDAVLT